VSDEILSNTSDASPTYLALQYHPGIHLVLPNKRQTYRVEGDNAELRHYLARLVRRSRCFSRSLTALWQAVNVFVYAWNRRQLYRQSYPDYPAHVMQFCIPLILATPEKKIGLTDLCIAVRIQIY